MINTLDNLYGWEVLSLLTDFEQRIENDLRRELTQRGWKQK